MYESALRITQHIRYAGAGTFEFIVDGEGHYYFLEMNTRLQVEHPVTEWVTGVDLVSWQVLLAAGEFQLPSIPERRGCAMEVRLYAEDPHTFLPAPGRLGLIELPSGAFVRSDTAFIEPGEVSLNYDPMISKISVWGATRPEALNRLRVALDETRVEPPKRRDKSVVGSLKTNLSFLKRLVRNATVESGDTTTDLIGSNPSLTDPASSEPSLEAALAVALNQILSDTQGNTMGNAMENIAGSTHANSAWAQIARREGVRL